MTDVERPPASSADPKRPCYERTGLGLVHSAHGWADGADTFRCPGFVHEPASHAGSTRTEYQAVCADGGTVTSLAHPTLADAVEHAKSMDSNPHCSPHRVQSRTVTYGVWRDV